jgi:lipopolysaccharide biosynthesis protein
MPKFCVFYSYFQTKESQKNLEFFIKNGISLNVDIFYVFLINNHNYSVKIPNQTNIKIICRDNIGHDFGSWKDGLEYIEKTFDYYIFMNDTVRGPFLPRYIPKNISWYQMFCNLISEKVKLSGLTINYFPFGNKGNDLQHVQSMMFCTDKVGLEILNKNIFNLSLNEYEIYIKNKKNFIIKFEIGMSQQIIKNGFDIAALYVCDTKKYKTEDIWYNNKYFKTTINPLETMFIKKNRIDSELIEFYTNNI